MFWWWTPPPESHRAALLVLCLLGFGTHARCKGACVDSIVSCRNETEPGSSAWGSELLLIQHRARWQRANLSNEKLSIDWHKPEVQRVMLQATTRLSATRTNSTFGEQQLHHHQQLQQRQLQQRSQNTHFQKTRPSPRQVLKAVAKAHNTVEKGSFSVRLTGESPHPVFIPDEPFTEREFAGAPVWAWIALMTNFAAGPVASILAMLQALLSQKQQKDALQEQLQQLGNHKPRFAYLDMWRFVCLVILMMSDNNPMFEAHIRSNVLAVQHWHMPLLVFVSGTCFSLASTCTTEIVAQLLRCFSLGTFINWLALMYARVPWWLGGSACGVTFSMRCVLGLTCCMVAGAPLKELLKTTNQKRVSTGSYAITTLLVFNSAWIMLLQRGDFMTETQAQFLRVLAQAAVSLLITTFGLHMLPRSSHGLIGWGLFAWIFVTRIAHPEPQLGLWFHLVEVFLFAMVAQHRPLRGQAVIGSYFCQWWPLGVLLIGTLLQPGVNLRQDLHPSQEIQGRARFYVVESIAVLAIATVPWANQDLFPVAGRIRGIAFVASRWASFAFITSFAIRKAAPTALWGSLVVVASAIPFATMTRRFHS
eukprot:CAMPEP_0172834944 /NCGR_PEP_ID=MMETSP1075-20121228/25381_1 /TAXON_ID=2916 /ORGANISM="Ceratium fusus, Strain PA161109" /LENGTH=590 /DNA_ID=CAMNT_0013677901 /DNA_START=96 /DNA_END=1868 /DNA_ORIENTATION=+